MDHIDESHIKDILIRENILSAEDANAAEKDAAQHRQPLIDYLLAEGKLTKDLLGQIIAESFNVPFADLNAMPPSQEQVLRIPEHIAKQYRVILFSEDTQRAVIASDAPSAGSIPFLQQYFQGKSVQLAYALADDIDASFVHYRKPLESRFVDILKNEKRVAPEMIDEIFDDALVHRASDVHFEPQEHDVIIRFRIDGVLHEVGRIPRDTYENVLNRMKVLAHLRTDEHNAAQDGAIRYSSEEKQMDLRVSIIPTLDGEKIALRLLSKYVRGFTLADLGLSPNNQKMLIESSKKPFGMILVTGPTGSGKTTTLYALIKMLNHPEVNITTIEDPVEYKLSSVNQIQVNMQTNLTFAQGLRSIVRQDPNVILVGEIRDEETAEIAVNAALTGHLLLSTFHANDAATAIPRLLYMGVEPFLLASTLEVIIAQRLVRTICETCRVSETQSLESLIKQYPFLSPYFTSNEITLFHGKGCPSCGQTGFRGRIAVYEFIQIRDEVEDLVLQNPSAKQIAILAQKLGFHTMFDDGIEKIRQGLTTLPELLRVVQPPDRS